MSNPRLKYGQLAPEGLAKMTALEHYRERAALAWAEAVTNIQEGHAPDVLYEAVRAEFTEVETVNLTLVISTINAWNRISIALGTHSGHGDGGGTSVEQSSMER